MSKFLFKENQQFREIPFFIILGILQLLFIWGLIQQVIAGKPWGIRPAPDLVIIGVNVVVFILIILLFITNLKTTITEKYFCVNLFPFHPQKRMIQWIEVLHVQLIKYDGIKEYWGYGIKYIPGEGWSYSLSGDYGLKLTLRGGEKLLVGTHKPWELSNVIYNLQERGVIKIL